ncbi:type VII secretion protein EccB [Phytomonospora sp. NPDC050363]|uniref:type VII secretion protein EccB n=1 Tax=Phytomonospora sp. NPDC050363 TaxID=3155642 RepID=UPI0033EA129D
MASRRDQLHSYQFMVQRVVSALVFRKTDPDQSPFRRAGGAVFASVMVAVLALAVTGIIGFIADGVNNDIAEGNAIILEKETGSRFVYIDGTLHPVINFASGALIVNSTNTMSRSRSSLAELPRGAPVGIPNAPDSIPDRGRLLDGDWALCARPGKSATNAEEINSVLFVGAQPAQGHELGPDEGVIAVLDKGEEPDERFLIANQHRFPIADPSLVIAIGGSDTDQSRSLTTEAAFLNSLPLGQPITLPSVPDIGADSAISGTKVGKIFGEPSGRRFVALKDGWTEVTRLQAVLIQSVTKDSSVTEVPSPASIGTASATPLFEQSEPGAPVMSAVPTILPLAPNGSTCATFANQSDAPRVLIDATVPESGGMKTSDTSTATGADLVDEVIIAPGHAALVESMTGTEGSGTVGFVNDWGVFYPFTSRSLINAFGYQDSDIIKLPSLLTSRLPVGPDLDPVAAKQNAIKSQ